MSDQTTEKDVQDLMRSWASSEQGQIIMSWMAHHYGYQNVSTHQIGASATDLAFREGQRSVYAGLMNFIYGPDIRDRPADVDEQEKTGSAIINEEDSNARRSIDDIWRNVDARSADDGRGQPGSGYPGTDPIF
jgi:hypothetical protein